MTFEQSIAEICRQDLSGLKEARRLYGDSWRAEGGFSAYFNIKRKIDRFIQLLKRDPEAVLPSTQPGFGAGFTRERYDLFGHIRFDVAKGGEATLDAVRDMRRYLLLAEAYMLETGLEMPKDRDNLEADKFQANLDKVRRQLEKPGFCLGPRGFDELLDTRPE